MKWMGVLLAIGLLVAGMFAFLPVADAEMDSLMINMSIEDREYEVGDTIEVEIQVFDKGVLVSGDQVNLTLSVDWGSWQDVNIIETATGLYEGTYTIQSGDDYLRFSLDVTSGTDHEDTDSRHDYLTVNVIDEDLELDITFDGQEMIYANPGDIVTATLRATYQGLVDVDQDEFDRLVLVDPDGNETELTSTKISTGVYETEITIPDDMENGEYHIDADASFAGLHDGAMATIGVNVLNIWYHKESEAGDTVTFTLGVADLEGKAAPGAMAVIEQPEMKTGTTSTNGTTVFFLDDGYVSGYVTYLGMNQSFEGYISLEDDGSLPNPSNHEFDVINQGDDDVYSPGSTFTRTYKAYNESDPLQNKDIYYYAALMTSEAVVMGGDIWLGTNSDVNNNNIPVDFGVATTNALGEFTITLTAPDAQGTLGIVFETGVDENNNDYDQDDDLVYETDHDDVIIFGGNLESSSSIEIDVDPLVVGGETKVTVTADPGEDGEIYARVIPGSIDEPTWDCWVEGGDFIRLEETADGEYTGQVVIPEFMDEEEYIIAAGYVGDDGLGQGNYVSLEEGEGTDDDDGNDLLILIVIVLAVVVLVIVLMKKNKPASAPPQLDLASEESAREEVAEEAPEEEEPKADTESMLE